MNNNFIELMQETMDLKSKLKEADELTNHLSERVAELQSDLSRLSLFLDERVSRRDFFAGCALINLGINFGSDLPHTAKQAFWVADVMLKESEKTK